MAPRGADGPATLARVAARRSALYWLLSEILLTHPDEALVTRLRRDLGSKSHESASSQLAAELSALGDELPEPQDVAGIQALAVEHTRLFGGISAANGPAPYESVHRGGDAAELAAVIAACYSAGGLDPVDRAVPCDHLGIELKFMALLCYREMQGWQQGSRARITQTIDQQRKFLDSHILRWAPGYWKFLQGNTRHKFFRGVATLSLMAVSEDRALIDELNSLQPATGTGA